MKPLQLAQFTATLLAGRVLLLDCGLVGSADEVLDAVVAIHREMRWDATELERISELQNLWLRDWSQYWHRNGVTTSPIGFIAGVRLQTCLDADASQAIIDTRDTCHRLGEGA